MGFHNSVGLYLCEHFLRGITFLSTYRQWKITQYLSSHIKLVALRTESPSFDVHINGEDGILSSSVYWKPTDAGWCLNAASECPERYRVWQSPSSGEPVRTAPAGKHLYQEL